MVHKTSNFPTTISPRVTAIKLALEHTTLKPLELRYPMNVAVYKEVLLELASGNVHVTIVAHVRYSAPRAARHSAMHIQVRALSRWIE